MLNSYTCKYRGLVHRDQPPYNMAIYTQELLHKTLITLECHIDF